MVETNPPETKQPPATTWAVILPILGVLAVLGGTAGAVVVVATQPGDEALSPARSVAALASLGLGLSVGGLLWAVTHMIRRRGRPSLLEESVRRTRHRRRENAGAMLGLSPLTPDGDAAIEEQALALSRAAEPHPEPHPEPSPEPSAEAATAEAPPAAPDPASGNEPRPGPVLEQRLLQEILAQLRDLNENLLLTDEQRDAKRALRQQRLRDGFGARVREAVEADAFGTADRLLDQFDERLPGDEAAEDLRRQVAEARAAGIERDVKETTRRVNDLMAVSEFARAEADARALCERYPEDERASDLLGRVRRESTTFQGERRERMYREVEREAEARHWRSALAAARRFIEAFPDSVDADAVRAMLPTMEDNARIEEVRELRDYIKDLIERRRYAEAAEAAEDVIRRFPDTRAAAELRRQRQRLHELARAPSGNAPRQG